MNSFQQTFRHLVDASNFLAGPPPLHPAPSSIPHASSCSSGPTHSSSSSSVPTPASSSSSGPLEFITSKRGKLKLIHDGYHYLLPCSSFLLLTAYLPLSPSPPSSCRTSFLSGLLRENTDWNTRWSNTTLDTRLTDPGVERLGEVCCWLYPYNKRLGGLPPLTPSTRWCPASTHLYGSSWTPWGTSRLTANTMQRIQRGCSFRPRPTEAANQLHSSNCWLLPQRNCFQLYVLILREFLGRLMYYHVNNFIILCEVWGTLMYNIMSIIITLFAETTCFI